MAIDPALVAGVLEDPDGVEVLGLRFDPDSPVGPHLQLAWIDGKASSGALENLQRCLAEELGRRAALEQHAPGAGAEAFHAWARQLIEQRVAELRDHRLDLEVVLERQAFAEMRFWVQQDTRKHALPLYVHIEEEFTYELVRYRTVRGAVPRVQISVGGRVVEELALPVAEPRTILRAGSHVGKTWPSMQPLAGDGRPK